MWTANCFYVDGNWTLEHAAYWKKYCNRRLLLISNGTMCQTKDVMQKKIRNGIQSSLYFTMPLSLPTSSRPQFKCWEPHFHHPRPFSRGEICRHSPPHPPTTKKKTKWLSYSPPFSDIFRDEPIAVINIKKHRLHDLLRNNDTETGCIGYAISTLTKTSCFSEAVYCFMYTLHQ